jgi:hypothetical protein
MTELLIPAVAITILLGVLIIELATTLTIGLPILRKHDANLVRKLLTTARLNPYDKAILSLDSGYISSCGFSVFGALYYTDCRQLQIRIPWWTGLYREVSDKYKELNK